MSGQRRGRALGLAFLFGAGAVPPLFAALLFGADALDPDGDTAAAFLALTAGVFFVPGVLLTVAAGWALRRSALYEWAARRPALVWGLIAAALGLALLPFVASASFALLTLAAVELSVALTWLAAVLASR